MIRWGTGPRLLTRPGLLTHDTRLPPERRHLSLSLLCLWDLLRQAQRLGLGLYRVASPLVPVGSSADLSRFRRQREECGDMLQWLAGRVRILGVRLTAHPMLQVQLGSADEEVAEAGLAAAEAWGQLWEALDPGGEAVTVVHLGGGGDGRTAAERFVRRVERLTPGARERLALENEDCGPSLDEALWAARRAGVPLVFDHLHWRCHNPSGLSAQEAVERALSTWRPGMTPKLHFSSPETGRGRRPPQPRQHGDYLDPFGYLDFERLLPAGRRCDIMLEAGAKDLALLKLRRDLAALEADRGGSESAERVGDGVAAG